jgi:hypothetical protein
VTLLAPSLRPIAAAHWLPALAQAQNFCQRFPHGRGPKWVGFDTVFLVSPFVTADSVLLILHFTRPEGAVGLSPGFQPSK